MIERLSKIDGDIIFFPVRHHSPTAAILVKQLIARRAPVAVLVEGPSDYNEHIHELGYDHHFPIAIYSYIRSGVQTRGAFYPFAEFSPEGQAVRLALEAKIPVRFIDMPFSHMVVPVPISHQYADGALSHNRGIKDLCAEFGVDDFDGLWDKLVESDDELDLAKYMAVVHGLCLAMRQSSMVSAEDARRERFMAREILQCRTSMPKRPLLVITGGYHAAGILEYLEKPELLEDELDTGPAVDSITEYGCTLTPFTDARLDAFRGYQAGLPSPGFYRQVWHDKQAGNLATSHEALLSLAVDRLRSVKQKLSTADLITAKSMAQGLSMMRGHKNVFRHDLMDGIVSAIVKDESDYEKVHPIVLELRSIFRGKERGRLSSLSSQPPLTLEILEALKHFKLDTDPEHTTKDAVLDLEVPDDRAVSAFLHKLKLLSISGIRRNKFTGFSGDERGRVVEEWLVEYSDSFHSDCIEASVWGSSTDEAAVNKLKYILDEQPGRTSTAVDVLMRACLMGLGGLTSQLTDALESTIEEDQDFLSVTKGLAGLVQLLSLDKVLATRPEADLHAIIRVCFERALWLLESLGSAESTDYLEGLSTIVVVTRTMTEVIEIDVNAVIDTMRRTRRQPDVSPLIAGGLSGALYNYRALDNGDLHFELMAFSAPDVVGEFLTGLFTLSRDLLKSHPALLQDLDRLVRAYTDDQFLEAVPRVRLAFTTFTPREKEHIVQNLSAFKKLKGESAGADTGLKFDIDQVATNVARDAKIKRILRRYGLRGLRDD